MTIFTNIQVPEHFKVYDKKPALKLKFEFTAHCRIYFTKDRFKDLTNHRYVFYLTVTSPINDMGLGVDFFEIEHIYQTHLEPKLNHQLLNHTLPEMNMTAENIAYWLWQSFNQHLPKNVSIKELELHETAGHSVILDKEMMD